MHAFDVLGNPVRRRILELLAEGELTSGAIVEVVQDEFGITQPAVSQHLRVLRESGFASAKAEGPRRVYFVDAQTARAGGHLARAVQKPLGAAPRCAGDGGCPRKTSAAEEVNSEQ
jgi:DNA-binding transcriptional ArsR family regulator